MTQAVRPTGIAAQRRVGGIAGSHILGRKGIAREFRASTACSVKVPFNLADIGEGIAEVTALPRKIRTRFMAEPAGLQVEVLQWYVKEGDSVAMFDKVPGHPSVSLDWSCRGVS